MIALSKYMANQLCAVLPDFKEDDEINVLSSDKRKVLAIINIEILDNFVFECKLIPENGYIEINDIINCHMELIKKDNSNIWKVIAPLSSKSTWVRDGIQINGNIIDGEFVVKCPCCGDIK